MSIMFCNKPVSRSASAQTIHKSEQNKLIAAWSAAFKPLDAFGSHSSQLSAISAIVRVISVAATMLLTLFALSSSTLAQSTYTPDVQNIGLPANGTYSGGSIDSVQLSSGNLHVDIPLLHLPGIGMDTDIHFTYDNQVFNVIQVPQYAQGTNGASAMWNQITMNRNFGQVSDPLSHFLKYAYHDM